MNYRHAFHAGNFADVLKHVVLTRIVEYLKRKEAGFFVLDTHAGRGRYDLRGEEAERTGEAIVGIGRLFGVAVPESVRPYLDAVGAVQDEREALRWYPGSPRIVRALMRPQDRLFAAELHPEDAAALKAEFAGDRRVRTFAIDGYQAIKAYLPPSERRGLVLIDPPFESADEFSRLVSALGDGLKRWATGTFLAWYPIKHRRQVDDFLSETAVSCRPRPTLCIELLLRRPDGILLAGCGLVVVNPPFVLEEEMSGLLPFLAKALRDGPAPTTRLEWLNAPP